MFIQKIGKEILYAYGACIAESPKIKQNCMSRAVSVKIV